MTMNYDELMDELFNDPEYLAYLEERAEESAMMELVEMGLSPI